MRFVLALAALLVACSDDGGIPFDAGPEMGAADFGLLDAGPLDMAVAPDAGADPDMAPDAGAEPDLGSEVDLGVDGGTPLDGGEPTDGSAPGDFGTIAGPCMRLDSELTSAEPFLFETRLDFMMDAFDDPEERPLLTAGAQEILADGTAGGSSELSEAFAYEVLARCEGATLLETETEIDYDTNGPLTDILVMMGSEKIGVSVTRAFVFPPSDPYTVTLATDLLTDKLMDVLESSANVSAADRWTKQILAVVAYGTMHAESIATAWASIDASLRADTIVYVIVTDGDDAPLY